MEEIVIKQSAGKQFRLMLLGIIMVVASALLMVFDVEILNNFIIGKAIGVIGTIFFGLCLIFIIARFFEPKDILIINENGFIDNSTASSIGFVLWDNVEKIYIKSVFTQKFISVDVKNVEQLLNNIFKTKIKAIRANIALGYSPVSITLNSAKENHMDVLQIMQEYLVAYHSKKM